MTIMDYDNEWIQNYFDFRNALTFCMFFHHEWCFQQFCNDFSNALFKIHPPENVSKWSRSIKDEIWMTIYAQILLPRYVFKRFMTSFPSSIIYLPYDCHTESSFRDSKTRYKKQATTCFVTVVHHRSQRLVHRTKTNQQTPGAFLHPVHYFFSRK